eukprot:NODE_260_length_11481_cov_1.187928.p4 type:complete len:325 gc:universal NODE_260_length_11481_cov_1.187928:8433-7459(-)
MRVTSTIRRQTRSIKASKRHFTFLISKHCLMKVFPNKLSNYSKAALMTAVLQAVCIIILEIVIAAQLVPKISLENKAEPLRGLPVYLAIFIFGQLFQIYFSWDAIANENTIQLFAWVGMNVASFGYSLFQIKDVSQVTNIWQSYSGYFFAICVLLAVFAVISGFLTFKLYCEYGWKVYKKIGADPRMKQMYRTYQIFLMLLKACFFVFVSFSLQFMILVLQVQDVEMYLTIAALICTVIILFVASKALKKENKVLMICFIFLTLLALAYFMFKLVRMYDATQELKYLNVRNYLTFFGIFHLFSCFVTHNRRINHSQCLFMSKKL